MEPNCWMPTKHSDNDPSVRNPRTNIEGRVLADGTDKPVEEALLILNPPAPGYDGTSAMSNSNGDYYFDELGNGTYKIIANHSAYLTETVTVRTYADSTVRLDIYMVPVGT